MELKSFVAESLEQIIDGVAAAQAHARERGAVINPAGLAMRSDRSVLETSAPRAQQEVEFDVAVTVEQESSKKGGGMLIVAPLGIGGQRQEASSAQTVSRVRFAVPVDLPVQKRNADS